MTLTHPALAPLPAALDAGDDTALGPLADVLEEMGDARAAGLRRPMFMILGTEGTYPPNQWWAYEGRRGSWVGRLRHGASRHAAYLALAAALSEAPQ